MKFKEQREVKLCREKIRQALREWGRKPGKARVPAEQAGKAAAHKKVYARVKAWAGNLVRAKAWVKGQIRVPKDGNI